ncbi:UNVERIFIED_CONTAM: hypothetical protein HDU68_006105, partial [Siphonaria sp. JEL0065]
MCEVDGILFQSQAFPPIGNLENVQLKFKKWLDSAWTASTDDVIIEYKRLTNLAFGVSSEAPLVFLFDEIQVLDTPTNVKSTFYNASVNHTGLSLLLTRLATPLKSLCLCAGTSDGKILDITEYSSVVPKLFSFTTLVDKYDEFWREMTNFENSKSRTEPLIASDDQDLIAALVYASYQIPRLLLFAHETWSSHRASGKTNREFFLQSFEAKALAYYPEMMKIWISESFSAHQLAHIILSCGVHYSVESVDSLVPGTEILFSTLIRQALVFPYLDNCYLIPFSLLWNADARSPTLNAKVSNRKLAVKEVCQGIVPNLKIE